MNIQSMDVISAAGYLIKEPSQGNKYSDIKLEEHIGNLTLLSEDTMIHPTRKSTINLSDFVAKYAVNGDFNNVSIKYIIFNTLEEALNPFEIARVKKTAPDRVINISDIELPMNLPLKVKAKFNKAFNIDQYEETGLCIYIEIYMIKR